MLSALRSTMEEETLVNAGHVARRCGESLIRYQLVVRGGFVRYLCKCNSCYTFHQMQDKIAYIDKYYPPSLRSCLPKSGSNVTSINQGLFLQRVRREESLGTSCCQRVLKLVQQLATRNRITTWQQLVNKLVAIKLVTAQDYLNVRDRYLLEFCILWSRRLQGMSTEVTPAWRKDIS